MFYVYPAVVHKNGDESFTIIFPDLPGCISEGKSLGTAMYMAQPALAHWIGYLIDKKQEIPEASNAQDMTVEPDEFVNLICVELKDGHAVKRTVSIPKWMDDKVVQTGLSLSRVLQEALNERLA
jgi:predicted RNase H-like HicB family nuclease